MTFTAEQAATLHTLIAEHGAQEAMVLQTAADRFNVWLYGSDDQLLATAVVDDLGGIRIFEWMGAIA